MLPVSTSYLAPALAAVRGAPGQFLHGKIGSVDIYRAYVAPRVLGVAAVYEGLYGSEVSPEHILKSWLGLMLVAGW